MVEESGQLELKVLLGSCSLFKCLLARAVRHTLRLQVLSLFLILLLLLVALLLLSLLLLAVLARFLLISTTILSMMLNLIPSQF